MAHVTMWPRGRFRRLVPRVMHCAPGLGSGSSAVVHGIEAGTGNDVIEPEMSP